MIQKAWGLLYSVPVLLGKHPQIWQLSEAERKKHAEATIDMLNTLPPEWFERSLKFASVALPSIALVSTVAMSVFPRMMQQAAFDEAMRQGEAQPQQKG